MQHRGIAAWIARLAVIGMLALVGVPLAGSVSAQSTPAIKIVSPSDGATITSNDIVVQVEVSNFTVSCAESGAADKDGTGQILAFVDGATIAQLTNIYCADTFTIPGEGLTPGKHQIAIVLASNTHAPMMDTAQSVTIDFQPGQAVPAPVANYTGDPAVKLVSPQDGATVPPVFDVQVQPTNFAPDTGLEGKMNVPGYGHYHVWVDAPEMPQSLAGLVLMPGTNAFTLDLSAWGEGQHTVRIEIAQNDHTMYDPQTSVTFTVNVSASATPVPSANPAASPAA